ncbi:hypothetical protein OEA41_005498 [Lepraria neglecta]|uniref:Uncharacterized protein n=1 Tax=Lepraria neglecta TaxID=209136 RepID=A0AAD9Z0L8_9LECA|nr:hypothetical protein OEA41_005498 [Lepraria neglecta]
MAQIKPASRFLRRPAPASWPNNVNIGNNRCPRFIAPKATQQHRHFLAAAKAKQRRKKFFADRKAARTQARANKKTVRLQSLGLTDAYPLPIQHLSKTQANLPTEDDIDWEKFQADWSAHNHLYLKWVQQALVKRRFDGHVSEELKEY